jgi:hypothetical protein
MKAAVLTSTAVFAISPSGQSAASYALAACREPSGIPPARVIDRRPVAAGGLAADDPASRIVVRRRAAAVGRRAGARMMTSGMQWRVWSPRWRRAITNTKPWIGSTVQSAAAKPIHLVPRRRKVTIAGPRTRRLYARLGMKPRRCSGLCLIIRS